MENENRQIVFFDGDCGFCNWSVQWIIKRDEKRHFCFASLQSLYAEQNLAGKINSRQIDSLVLLSNGHVYIYSEAVLNICRQLPYPYKLMFVFGYIPKFIRDYFYRWIARNRKKIMNNNHQCTILNADERSRFL